MQPGPYTPSAHQPPPAVRGQLVRPAKWWFVVAALIALAGIVVAVVLLVVGISGFADRIDEFDRAGLPAALEVDITDTGGYSIYHEYDGADSDTVVDFVPDPEVSVTDPSGDPVELDSYSGSVTYHASGHEGEGLYTFDAAESGTYVVAATGDLRSGIAVGRGIGRGLVAPIVGSVAISLLSVVGGAVLAIVVGVKRGSNRRALMPPPVFRGWGPPPPGWGGPPGPGGYGPGAVPGGYGPGPGDSPAPGGPAAPGGYGPAPAQPPPPPPPPPPLSGPSDAPPPTDRPPTDASSGPAPGGPGASLAVGVARARAPSPLPPATPGGTVSASADPPSLRSPVDWSSNDVPLHWSSRP